MARAAEMILTGDRVDAVKALEWGLVSSVVAPDKLLDEARALAGRVAANPPHSVRMAKRLLREGQHQSLDSLLELSAAMQALVQQTTDHTEQSTPSWRRELPPSPASDVPEKPKNSVDANWMLPRSSSFRSARETGAPSGGAWALQRVMRPQIFSQPASRAAVVKVSSQ